MPIVYVLYMYCRLPLCKVIEDGSILIEMEEYVIGFLNTAAIDSPMT